MRDTRYTIKALRNEVKRLRAMYPKAKLEDWGIQVFDNKPARLWVDFVRSDNSDLIQAHTLL